MIYMCVFQSHTCCLICQWLTVLRHLKADKSIFHLYIWVLWWESSKVTLSNTQVICTECRLIFTLIRVWHETCHYSLARNQYSFTLPLLLALLPLDIYTPKPSMVESFWIFHFRSIGCTECSQSISPLAVVMMHNFLLQARVHAFGFKCRSFSFCQEVHFPLSSWKWKKKIKTNENL